MLVHRWLALPLGRTAIIVLYLCGPAIGRAAECANGSFDGTFALLQQAIFANHGCTVCHSANGPAGLDLSPAVAYDNLVSRPARSVPPDTIPGLMRVVPGQKDQSLLFINLAARTLPDQWTAPLRGMPLGGLPALSVKELEAVRLWIEGGAPREGVVSGTGELLDACLPPPKPIEIEPLDPPAPGEGVQLHMPRWILRAQSEREVCFVSYYDVTEQVPAEFRGADGTTFRFHRLQTRQDPLSHHMIVYFYDGATAPDDPVWGPFTCKGGALDGEPCDPTELGACGPDSECGSAPTTSVACHGFGPIDANPGLSSRRLIGKQKASTESTYPEGVYGEVPLKGVIMWNSHAFNATREDGKLEAWLNFDFAAADQQTHPVQAVFDDTAVFEMNAPAFGTEEVCNHHTFPEGAHLFELTSHTHKRGKRLRVFLGKFACDGGPHANEPCTPFGPDADFDTADPCPEARCVSEVPPGAGDCNRDMRVEIDELMLAVNIGLGRAARGDCPPADRDGNGAVSIDELVAAVGSAIQVKYRDPDESLLYTSFVYNDPLQLKLEPPLLLGASGSPPEDRTLTYCALYDNGFTNPDEVKRQSTSPSTPDGYPGGPCREATGCIEGRPTEACSGATPAERDASCDSSAGAGDGFCDACPLVGGVTSDDEMFILLGSYFVD